MIFICTRNRQVSSQVAVYNVQLELTVYSAAALRSAKYAVPNDSKRISEGGRSERIPTWVLWTVEKISTS